MDARLTNIYHPKIYSMALLTMPSLRFGAFETLLTCKTIAS
jgi:hypothetical protein